MLRGIASLILLALCLSQAAAFIVITWGFCPKVTPKADFDRQKYLGLWMSYENFEVPYQVGLDCVTALYSPGSEPGSIQVVNRGFERKKKDGNYTITEVSRSVGKAVVPNPEVPGGLRVNFGSSSLSDLLGDDANYLVVDTDYSSFSIVYSCYDFSPFIPLKVEAAWVLTREPGPPSNLDDIYRKLTTLGVNVGYFRKINQDKCWE